MNEEKNSNTILKEMYEEFLNEKSELLATIHNNEDKIAEADRYLESLFEKEDKDFKVFSPRNIESIYKERIEEERAQKEKFEKENQILYKKVGFYLDNLEKLEAMMKAEEEKEVQSISNSMMIEIQEKERKRIANDLHDTTVQNLIHLIHKIELCSKYMDKDIVSAKMELVSVNQVIKSTIDDIRNTIFNLRPMVMDDLGFYSALERLQSELAAKTEGKMDINFSIKKIEENNQVVIMSLYRIIQECCNNAMKHSEGNRLDVKLWKENNKIILVVKDNGKGFNPEIVKDKKNFGLLITKERVQLLSGKITIDSKKKEGTSIRVEIPQSVQRKAAYDDKCNDNG